MLIVGERINSSRNVIAQAAGKFDAALILGEAKLQVQAGARVLDVNAGTFAEKEGEYLKWIIETLISEIDTPLCIDSTDPEVVGEALQLCGKGMMINSITAETRNYSRMLPLIREYDCEVVALCMDDNGIPAKLQEKLNVGFGLVDRLLSDGIAVDKIYVDPLIMAVSTVQNSGITALRTIREIVKRYPGIHTICGLSNISFGLPVRKLMNRAFLVAAMTAGLDAIIVDPLDERLMATLIAANTLLGRDEHCREYLAAFRDNKLAC